MKSLKTSNLKYALKNNHQSKLCIKRSKQTIFLFNEHINIEWKAASETPPMRFLSSLENQNKISSTFYHVICACIKCRTLCYLSQYRKRTKRIWRFGLAVIYPWFWHVWNKSYWWRGPLGPDCGWPGEGLPRERPDTFEDVI